MTKPDVTIKREPDGPDGELISVELSDGRYVSINTGFSERNSAVMVSKNMDVIFPDGSFYKHPLWDSLHRRD